MDSREELEAEIMRLEAEVRSLNAQVDIHVRISLDSEAEIERLKTPAYPEGFVHPYENGADAGIGPLDGGTE